jgi:hypothetical protein
MGNRLAGWRDLQVAGNLVGEVHRWWRWQRIDEGVCVSGSGRGKIYPDRGASAASVTSRAAQSGCGWAESGDGSSFPVYEP